jgi:hypothetical protein
LTIRAALESSAYHDTDHVNVATPTVAVGLSDPLAGWSVDARYLVDAVSAASVDIVTSASARWSEIRHVGSLDVKYKPGDLGMEASAGVSREPDYLALSAGGTLTLDLGDKNFTPMLGYSYGHDTAGRSGTPFSIFGRTLIKHGARAGVTVIVDRATTLDLVGDAIFESGDQAKPYRYIPLFAPGMAARIPAGASPDDVNDARMSLRPAEELPLTRERYALSARLAHRFSGSTLRLEQRLYDDSWGLLASSTDVRQIWDLGASVFVWPHFRAHLQKGVDFRRRAYEVSVGPGGGLGVPKLRAGDRELGPLHSYTAGAGLRLGLGEMMGARWSVTGQADVVWTRYSDALYLTERTAYFGALGLEAVR